MSTPTRASQQDKWKKRPLCLLNINFQSSPGKRAEILNLLESTRPDIVVGTETWLDSSIQDSEVFPGTYKVFRKDRNRYGGGVNFQKFSSNRAPRRLRNPVGKPETTTKTVSVHLCIL